MLLGRQSYNGFHEIWPRHPGRLTPERPTHMLRETDSSRGRHEHVHSNGGHGLLGSRTGLWGGGAVTPTAGQDRGNGTGGGWSADEHPGMTAAEAASNRAELAKAAAYDQEAQRVLASRAIDDAVALAPDCTPEIPCPPARDRVLGVAHVGQIENYYCGPAAGLMILRTLGAGASRYSGKSLSQRSLADYDHMRTDANGRTSWWDAYRPFRTGLNRWRDRTTYQHFESPTNAEFRSSLRYDIDRGLPFGVATIEYSGRAHYNFHPSEQEIGHWIVAQGYADNLDRTSFDDPAANAPGLSSAWGNVRNNFVPFTNSFNQTYVAGQQRGSTGEPRQTCARCKSPRIVGSGLPRRSVLG